MHSMSEKEKILLNNIFPLSRSDLNDGFPSSCKQPGYSGTFYARTTLYLNSVECIVLKRFLL